MTNPTFSTTGNGDSIRDKIAVFSQQRDYNRFHEVMIATVDFRGDVVARAEAIQFHKIMPEDQSSIWPPTLSGPMAGEFLQAALEAAWAAGLRPKNWRLETTEQVAAMDNHLQDMRRLVFGKPMLTPQGNAHDD